MNGLGPLSIFDVLDEPTPSHWGPLPGWFDCIAEHWDDPEGEEAWT